MCFLLYTTIFLVQKITRPSLKTSRDSPLQYTVGELTHKVNSLIKKVISEGVLQAVTNVPLKHAFFFYKLYFELNFFEKNEKSSKIRQFKHLHLISVKDGEVRGGVDTWEPPLYPVKYIHGC